LSTAKSNNTDGKGGGNNSDRKMEIGIIGMVTG